MKPIIHQERVMLYNLPTDSPKGMKARQILSTLGIQIIELSADRLGQTVGYCAGISGYSFHDHPQDSIGISDDVMIMVGLSDEKINQLLAQLRKAGTGSIGLMAVVTEHNRSWTVSHLFQELSSERRIMAAYLSLQQSIKAAEALADHDPARSEAIHLAVATAKKLALAEEPPDLEAIRQADKELAQFLA